jgi:hypothetical protein
MTTLKDPRIKFFVIHDKENNLNVKNLKNFISLKTFAHFFLIFLISPCLDESYESIYYYLIIVIIPAI